ncbi:hypothetical protein OZX72_06820 [Bifidobacterium sp. ESL0769]|uniref:hypothetical protein n=1 Tax=Bifidobacterium sp. ESL0769 TaxID=2983229 RepID=UPI0023F87A49|nr:hypothetical protein [Bifidobacterium sp. ESL0769]WEV66959.1 hypothetical protein OZX72_06820 [Bifidobacterium sp. ESL0769]
MTQSKQQLQSDMASANSNAWQCEQNAAAAQIRVDALNAQISAVNAAIKYAQDFKNGALDNLKKQDDGIMKLLNTLGSEAGMGIGDYDACCQARNISSGNKDFIDQIDNQCNSIINRLNQQLSGLSGQLSDAQNTVTDQNKQANSARQRAASAQRQLRQIQS